MKKKLRKYRNSVATDDSPVELIKKKTKGEFSVGFEKLVDPRASLMYCVSKKADECDGEWKRIAVGERKEVKVNGSQSLLVRVKLKPGPKALLVTAREIE